MPELYTDLQEAARAYDEAAKKTHGEFARLNFPDGAANQWEEMLLHLLNKDHYYTHPDLYPQPPTPLSRLAPPNTLSRTHKNEQPQQGSRAFVSWPTPRMETSTT